MIFQGVEYFHEVECTGGWCLISGVENISKKDGGTWQERSGEKTDGDCDPQRNYGTSPTLKAIRVGWLC